MLRQLLEIKKRREQRLRRQMQAGDLQQKENQKKFQKVVAQRDQLQQEWRHIGQREHGGLTRNEFEKLRRQLADCHHQDNQMADSCHSLKQEEAQWLEQRKALEQSIRQTSIEQEKLKYLVEHNA
ncbi:hypothetical protein GE278_23525 (plasmid) [Enterobacteriaceae bacterium Kacie_13]|nr:hypothetical protein GE278_23525 [Enterobacteriaceae bacterium Kacie_13]